jgi:hypothetical protein
MHIPFRLRSAAFRAMINPFAEQFGFAGCEMETSTWIAIYLPIFILFFIILPQQNGMYAAMRRNHAKRRIRKVTNETLAKFIGKTCMISAGSYGVNVAGRIVSVNENWIEVENKKGAIELVNADYVQSVRIVEK